MTTSTAALARLEDTVLAIVQETEGRAGWHEIAMRLSTREVPRQPELMAVLKHLRQQGLLVSVPREDASDAWALTAKGAERLAGSARLEQTEAPAEQQLVAALRAGPAAIAQAVAPLSDEPARLRDRLLEALVGEAGLARAVAFAAHALPIEERGVVARSLLTDTRPSVRRALFEAWAPERTDTAGGQPAYLPENEWLALLRASLADPDLEIRCRATTIAFASDSCAPLSELLLDNAESPDERLRWASLLALGQTQGQTSLAMLRSALRDDAEAATAAVRALAARRDGREDWLRTLDDARAEVREAALFALSEVVEGLSAEDLAALEARSRDEAVRAAAADYRRRTESAHE